MTRTDVMASSRPRTASAAPVRSGSRSIMRGLLVLPAALLAALAIMVPSTAVAAEPTSGYGQTPTTTAKPPPTTPATTPATTPSTGTLPSKEAEKPATTPEKETAPAKASSTPTTSSEKATTLPFTGFDLRWDIGLGLVLMGAGFTIVAVQRRQRRESGR
jgi:hypothetical protein